MKKLLSAVLSVMMISSSLFAGALNAEITETADEASDNAYTVSEAVLEEEFKPGINLLTGTKEKYSFDRGETPLLVTSVNGGVLNETYTTTVSNGMYILYNSGVSAKHYANLNFNLSDTIPAGRKYAIVTDSYGESADGTVFSNLSFGYQCDVLNRGVNKADKSGNWKTFWFVSVNETDTAINKGGNKTKFQYSGHEETGESYYFNNVGLYLYYNVNYYGADNETVIATEQVLLDDNGELLTSFSPLLPSGVAEPEKDGRALAGWSQTPGSGSVQTDVALENSDIELYPVFGTRQVRAGDPGINLLTGSTDVLDFDINELSSDKVDIVKQGKFEVVSIGENKALRAYGNGYPILFANTTVTKERPVYYKLKALKYIPSDITNESDNRLFFALVPSKGSGTRVTSGFSQIKTTSETPVSVSELGNITAVTARSNGYDSVEADAMLYPEIQVQKIVNTASVSIYLDDIGMYPYYKATYHLGADNTAAAYFLLDDDGGFLTEYTPVLPEDSAVTVPAGKKLIGWSTEENSDTAMDTVALENTDIELYPVFSDADYAPKWFDDKTDVKDVTEIRVQKDGADKVIDTKSGLRFKSYITDENKLDGALTEYGFIVALTDKLGEKELTHEFKYDGLADGQKAYIAQPSFVKGSDTDLKLWYDTDNSLTVFSCVLVNIPVSHYNDSFTVRAYSYVNGEYVYGSPMNTSILDILNYLSQNGNDVQKENADILLAKYNASLG